MRVGFVHTFDAAADVLNSPDLPERAALLRHCVDRVRSGEPFFYERVGAALVMAVNLNGQLRWFDCTMRSAGGGDL